MTISDDRRQGLARALLTAYERLNALDVEEPQIPDDNPSEAEAGRWLAWHDKRKLAHKDYLAAMAEFEVRNQSPVAHPMDFIPKIRQILGLPEVCRFRIAHTCDQIVATGRIHDVPACAECIGGES